MGKRGCFVFFLILLFLLLVVVGLGMMAWMMIKPEAQKIESGTVVELELEGGFPEGTTGRPLEPLVEKSLSIYDIRQILDYAARDNQVNAILLKIRPLEIGWGAVEELRDALRDFRKSNKKIYALLDGDFVEEKEYYLATTADKIVVNPESGMLINGLIAQVQFFRKAFDKLNIEPDLIQFKEYKSAAEPLMREHMSEYFREVLDSMLTDIQERFVKNAAESRKLDPTRIQSLMELGMFVSRRAKEEGLIDQLGYKNDVENELAFGEKEGKKDYRGVAAKSYLRYAEGKFKPSPRYKMALIFAEGAITSGKQSPYQEGIGGETLSGYLREARKNKDIKAIVMRINSPGGSAVGSDLIWREVVTAKKENKPVVASMSTVAGSGGYYIAMGANTIVCQPSTITGSIGVVGGKINVRGFFEDWLKINVDTVKKSKNADILSFYTSMDEEQRERWRDWMQNVYNDFVTKVAEGRNSDYNKIEPLAHGRVWTGRQAKEKGLIDELGGLDVALKIAKEKAGIPAAEPVELVIYPKKKSLWEVVASLDVLVGPNLRQKTEMEYLRDLVQRISQPQPWLMMPDIDIH
jgi:protease-4